MDPKCRLSVSCGRCKAGVSLMQHTETLMRCGVWLQCGGEIGGGWGLGAACGLERYHGLYLRHSGLNIGIKKGLAR